MLLIQDIGNALGVGDWLDVEYLFQVGLGGSCCWSNRLALRVFLQSLSIIRLIRNYRHVQDVLMDFSRLLLISGLSISLDLLLLIRDVYNWLLLLHSACSRSPR